MKFTQTTLDAAVFDGSDSTNIYKVRIKGYLFYLPGTELRLVAHKVIEREKRIGPYHMSREHWMVSEPRTGLRVLHAREYLTRTDAIDAAIEDVEHIGLSTTMEKIMLALAKNTNVHIQTLEGENIGAEA